MTMNKFSTAELTAMQEAQEAAMMDSGDLLMRFGTDRVDEYGMPVVEWTEEAVIDCGLDLRASEEMLNAEAHYYDARLRLPIDTDVDNVDRVRITKRFGVMLAEELTFEVIGEARRGPSGLVLDLKSLV
jgi:hypothetical protein